MNLEFGEIAGLAALTLLKQQRNDPEYKGVLKAAVSQRSFIHLERIVTEQMKSQTQASPWAKPFTVVASLIDLSKDSSDEAAFTSKSAHKLKE